MKLVECVPNFSEGRDRKILDAIGAAITSVSGIRLLDVDPGAATNRTVVTFVGPIGAVEEAAFLAIRKAAELIDMRRHKGTHARMGATDVCPFVPLGETTMQECVDLARKVGRRVGEDLGIPIYLYERAATSDARRSLADIRKGEYEALPEKLAAPEWKPDFGPARFNERSGATVVGAREFLIAYNVNLNTRDRKRAHRIAQNIRETGRPKRGPDGKILRDEQGAILTEPGPSRLDAVRATGWYIEEYGRAQVSINLTNFRVTSLHQVFEAVEKEAAGQGLRVTGSEIVGLVPLEAMRMAGRHFLDRQGASPAQAEPELIRTAVVSLGLAELAPFDPDQKIIERTVAPPRALASLSVDGFVDEVSSTSPAPGGGSVSALAGSLAAGLTAMVAVLSHEKKGMEALRDDFARLGLEAHAIKQRLVLAIDEDTKAFDAVMEATRMRRRTDEEKQARQEALQAATLQAIAVPLSVMRDSLRALELAAEIADKGTPAALSDAGVAALAAAAAVEGAWYNVAINLAGVADTARAASLRKEASDLLERAEKLALATRGAVRKRLDQPA